MATRHARGIRRLGILALLLLAVFVFSLQYFVHNRINATSLQEPRPIPAGQAERTGIIVATGGSHRIEHGLRLLLDGSAKRMLISGIGAGVRHRDIAAIAAPTFAGEQAELAQMLASRVDLGPMALNTRGNATEASRWAEQHKLTTLMLVTADYHMPRALRVFRHHMPDRLILAEAVPTPWLQPQRLQPGDLQPGDLQQDDTQPGGLQSMQAAGQWWQTSQRLLLLGGEFIKYLASLISPAGRQP